MRPFVAVVALLPALLGCVLGAGAERGRASTADAKKEAYENAFGVHPRERERNLKKRFPGLEQLRLVKATISAHDRSGPCWTAVAPLHESALEVEYAREEDSEARSLSGSAELADHGGRVVYRTPEGRGFELPGPFRSVDLEVGTSFRCRCSEGEGVLEGDEWSLSLRLRWSRGGMPEVSAATRHEGRRKALRPRLTSGELFGYEFETRFSFPGGMQGRCGVRADLALLVDPPIQ